MNDIQIFNYQDHEVRTVQMGGEPWFVLKDVCEVLGLSDTNKTAERLDPDELTRTKLVSGGQEREMYIINESGLYNVILRSDKPQAKPFRRWVTGEVLPSIRKHGGYIAGQAGMSDAELLAKALMVAQRTIADRDAQLSALTVENEVLTPKAEFFDHLVDRNMLTSFRDTAKEFGISPKKFVNFLLERKFVYRDKKGKLTPYEAKNDGYFEVKETFNEKTNWSGTQTLLTPKGRETFRLLTMGL